MNFKQPSISVLMPVYNSEKTLEQAVNSVLRQTYENFELILVDDGSTDRSWGIMQQFAIKDSRIKIFQNSQNLGLMKTLNRALTLAQTELIARIDSDDEMIETRLELQKKYLDHHSETAVLGTQYSFMGRHRDKDIAYPLPTDFKAIQAQILNDNPMCHS